MPTSDEPACAESCRSGRALDGQGRGELLLRRLRLLEARGQERLGRSLACVTPCEETSCVLQVLVCEGEDLEPAHRP